MLDRTALIYRYDGTQDGLLCCIYEAMKKREQPMMILSAREMQSMLFEDRFIETDPAVARRVADGIRGRISQDALTMVGRALLTHLPGKEIHLLDVLRRAFREGPGLLSNLSDPQVNKLDRAITFLEREAHLLTGFIRFRESGGVLTAVIEPKNQVLPLLVPHFEDRFRQETFLIHDRTHGEALVHRAAGAHGRGETRIVPVEAFEQAPPGAQEQAFQRLWRAFFRTIAVEGRENPVCQRTLMPKRYWAQMTEHQPEGAWPEALPLEPGTMALS